MQDNFISRHIGPNAKEIAEMLTTLEVGSVNDLMDKAVPDSIRMKGDIPLHTAMNETQALEKLRGYANQNVLKKSCIGMGYYNTITPPVIQRNVLEHPGWYTAYTPYQPEISQGRLEALLNFQQMIIDLTSMEIANASLLDEGTAVAEAMTMSQRVNKKNKSNIFLIADDLHPQTLAILNTRARPLGIELVTFSPKNGIPNTDAFGLALQYPNTYGDVQNIEDLITGAHNKDTLVTVATDLLALTVLKSPGEMGADIVVGSAQRFGVPMGYGGPHAAFFATRDVYKRSVPGRIVGVSTDSQGNTALRLALQTREQHIRRDKATSNICTAQVLLANIASFYAVWHGAEGLKAIANRTHSLTVQLAETLQTYDTTLESDHYFDTITIHTGNKTETILKTAEKHGFNLRDFGDGRIGISLDECSTVKDITSLVKIICYKGLGTTSGSAIPDDLKRRSDFLTHPIFNQYRSETEMLRYLRRLVTKDIALDRSMIPLGSCTMKLNATAEMMPISWPEFANLHPFTPLDQVTGTQKMIAELEDYLNKITGFHATSLQPNAGSQGEYSGLLIIKAYHDSRGDTERNICLVPASAHGTNPASAVMAAMKVVVVKCDENGNIDVADLKDKAQTHKDNLSALMVTYPSTHGVFESAIAEICTIIHDNGGQVYLDGANLNAMMGLAQPGQFGADVMHMNLHKTFCILHGGGGPGVGPIGVAKHLAPYLPGSPVVKSGGTKAISAISAAPWGSALILPISWMYITMMGAEGLKASSEIAILNANYLAKRLEGHYDTLYKGDNSFVAHECILDTRHFQKSANISVDDIAKRLIDFGFHAPT
ncbi:MAG: aminomethyl-transferring glycine dehydrogenase, partial [Gammaproteobacteria bacterium]|nr:aminomethyl-transferring glycine dehydrogenase [Gammaproteobacteria bacterium]